jgi:hypothetical protein
MTDQEVRDRLSDPRFWAFLAQLSMALEGGLRGQLRAYWMREVKALVDWMYQGSPSPRNFWDTRIQDMTSTLLEGWKNYAQVIGGRLAAQAGYIVGPGRTPGFASYVPWTPQIAAQDLSKSHAQAQYIIGTSRQRIEELKSPAPGTVQATVMTVAERRTQNIARALGTRANQESQLRVLERVRIDRGFRDWKIWRTMEDNRVRHSHQNLDRRKIPEDQEFKPLLAYPGDPRAPMEEVINCRCFLEHVLE